VEVRLASPWIYAPAVAYKVNNGNKLDLTIAAKKELRNKSKDTQSIVALKKSYLESTADSY
jgi:hypothetical protein